MPIGQLLHVSGCHNIIHHRHWVVHPRNECRAAVGTRAVLRFVAFGRCRGQQDVPHASVPISCSSDHLRRVHMPHACQCKQLKTPPAHAALVKNLACVMPMLCHATIVHDDCDCMSLIAIDFCFLDFLSDFCLLLCCGKFVRPSMFTSPDACSELRSLAVRQ